MTNGAAFKILPREDRTHASLQDDRLEFGHEGGEIAELLMVLLDHHSMHCIDLAAVFMHGPKVRKYFRELIPLRLDRMACLLDLPD